MKKSIFVILIFITIFASACKHGVDIHQATMVVSTPNMDPTSYSSGESMRLQINKDNVDGFIRASIRSSFFIMEGTVTSKVTLQPGQCSYINNPNIWDMYMFEDLEIISGRYDSNSLLLQVPHDDNYEPRHDYNVGQRYICIVFSLDSVTYPYDEIIYQGMGIVCKLDSENEDRIDTLFADGFQTDYIQTKQEFVHIVEEEIGIKHEYYHPNDKYIHSNDINEIASEAPMIVEVYVNQVHTFSSVLDHCTCEIIRIYKGEIVDTENNCFLLNVRPDTVEAGKRYIIMMQETYFEPHYIIASKKNSVIPITDTDRVQQVYDALGIQPEP